LQCCLTLCETGNYGAVVDLIRLCGYVGLGYYAEDVLKLFTGILKDMDEFIKMRKEVA
jgi:threonine aldolase